jgi:hypothetical protein
MRYAGRVDRMGWDAGGTYPRNLACPFPRVPQGRRKQGSDADGGPLGIVVVGARP